MNYSLFLSSYLKVVGTIALFVNKISRDAKMFPRHPGFDPGSGGF